MRLVRPMQFLSLLPKSWKGTTPFFSAFPLAMAISLLSGRLSLIPLANSGRPEHSVRTRRILFLPSACKDPKVPRGGNANLEPPRWKVWWRLRLYCDCRRWSGKVRLSEFLIASFVVFFEVARHVLGVMHSRNMVYSSTLTKIGNTDSEVINSTVIAAMSTFAHHGMIYVPLYVYFQGFSVSCFLRGAAGLSPRTSLKQLPLQELSTKFRNTRTVSNFVLCQKNGARIPDTQDGYASSRESNCAYTRIAKLMH